ncbi:Dabb family protein [Nocardia sp. alder85J]|uniref:Dabb family protein n=1 Tax=Nocardia sp. alder85J TaxID=2862949 RepID=UPI001CD4A04E|nr:Dabb family protein [Nocardia sp. alder85J]MCX4094296.1 Dabb family protein [Nocardia sp. alder85J]
MIFHQLRFRFRDETTEEQREAVLARMRRIATVESVSFSTVGRRLGDSTEDGLTHGYHVAIADLAALERYMYDPEQIEGDPHIIPHIHTLVIGPDVTDDPDPELAAKVMEINQRKLAEYPEWAALMASVPDFRIAL